ncbi:hypothetical protein PYCCODRAFT_1472537 [Trametes coccinea BRFM310]|uniref:Uncharacterized protein n=1 Tax=Trametes coccinea (strain BRFM310) TaxID=1353009 RepID=A0A1Y2I5Z6_TRAC3|nr:hypothetical protein PYCCODRAFT_1472537 [Trametes coccinea BRFM310]
MTRLIASKARLGICKRSRIQPPYPLNPARLVMLVMLSTLSRLLRKFDPSVPDLKTEVIPYGGTPHRRSIYLIRRPGYVHGLATYISITMPPWIEFKLGYGWITSGGLEPSWVTRHTYRTYKGKQRRDDVERAHAEGRSGPSIGEGSGQVV